MARCGLPQDDDELQKNAAAKKAAEAEKKAREMALSDDQRKEGGPSRTYTGNRISMLPLTMGRALFEGFYNSYVKQNYLWDQVTDQPFLPAFKKPDNWHKVRPKVDSNGLPLLDSKGDPVVEYDNDMRRLYYPNGHFISRSRYDQWEQAVVDCGEPAWQALWGICVRQARWEDEAVEANIRSDAFWSRRYLSELPPLDPDEDDDCGQSVTLGTTGDGGTPPSSPGLASVEA